MSKPDIVWTPLPAQRRFLTCPALEVLFHGTRGGGKTDGLLWDFAQFVGRGYGQAWRGVLFREEHTQLKDVVAKSQKWFPKVWPTAKWYASPDEYCWKWPSGETLYFRHGKRASDYNKYHGHEYPWIGFEELTNWSSPDFYLAMHSTCRSSNKDAPRRIRSTSNPWGPGHSWVKHRFIDQANDCEILEEDGLTRCHISSNLRHNPHLMEADPDYIKRLENLEDEAKRTAWLTGSWDIVAGGMFSDVWDASKHVLDPFPIPSTWRVDRSFDWGSSKPFSVGWWAESDGCDVTLADGSTIHTIKGDLFRIGEWYGSTKKPNTGLGLLAVDIARGILEREKRMGLRVHPGPADSAIYTTENGNCIADDMEQAGVKWVPANKSKGSRVNGWELIKRALVAATHTPHEEPCLRVFSTCRDFIRTVPILPRDDKNPDDINTDAEDHIADEARYRLLHRKRGGIILSNIL